MTPYSIREVDGDDEVDTLTTLHSKTFDPTCAPMGDFADGYWWIVYLGGDPIGFAGICESYADDDVGYFSRVGVLPGHRGNKLQLRLMRCLEAKARRVGWKQIITDTTYSLHSSNNIIAAGFKLFSPKNPWGLSATLYWTKDLTNVSRQRRRRPKQGYPVQGDTPRGNRRRRAEPTRRKNAGRLR